MSFISRALIKNAAEEICKYIDDRHAVDVDVCDIMSILSYHATPIIEVVEEGAMLIPED